MNCAGCLSIEGWLLKKCWWLSLHRKNAADWMFVLQERKYHGRQITLSRKVFRYLFYRKANIRVDVTEDVLAFGIVLITLAFGIQWDKTWVTLKKTPAYLQDLFYINLKVMANIR